jgi:hypothetical protein
VFVRPHARSLMEGVQMSDETPSVPPASQQVEPQPPSTNPPAANPPDAPELIDWGSSVEVRGGAYPETKVVRIERHSQ